MSSDSRFRVGDRVTKRFGEVLAVGRVVQLTSRRGDPFLMVWIASGPKKNQREYPKDGWHVQVDYPGGTHPVICEGDRCEREFKIKVPDQVGEIFCAQCTKFDERGGDGGDGWIGSDEWKRRHLPRGAKA